MHVLDEVNEFLNELLSSLLVLRDALVCKSTLNEEMDQELLFNW